MRSSVRRPALPWKLGELGGVDGEELALGELPDLVRERRERVARAAAACAGGRVRSAPEARHEQVAAHMASTSSAASICTCGGSTVMRNYSSCVVVEPASDPGADGEGGRVGITSRCGNQPGSGGSLGC